MRSMRYRPLGTSGLEVSELGLGTMTFGQQTPEDDAFAQMDLARERGVNLFDAAEMYPVPPREETAHRTEEILGRYLEARGCRDSIVLATKVTGRAAMPWIRGGPRLSRAHVIEAVEGSLRRLRTDRIDLYQLHWPDRPTNFFGQLGYSHPATDDSFPLEETLAALAELVASGKVRHVGLSNETPWGVMKSSELHRTAGAPRMMAIQNPYSLVNRSFEVGLAEIAIKESIGLLAYSPLGFGVLTGKYLGGAMPEGSRLALYGHHFTRYTKANTTRAVEHYVAIARAAGLSPAQMALSYVTSRPFVTSNLVGARTVGQLAHDLDSAELTLPADVLDAIEEVHRDIPNPSP